jgi:hypothetical protein
MAAPSYGTDLLPVTTAEDTTNWAEMTGRTSGGAPAQEDRAYIQGSFCVSQSTGAASGRTVGLQYDYGSNISWTAGFVFLFWLYWQAPKAIGAWADGGHRVGVGSSAGNVRLWNAAGNDYGRNPYGGFQNFAVDPTYNGNTGDETIGSPTNGAYRIFVSAPYLLQTVSKGNPHCVDAIRYGRGQIKAEGGDLANGYATFAGLAGANDADAARWGLFSYQQGAYLWKGLLSLGTASAAADFRDSAKTIFVDDCPRTYADFNKVEVRNAGSRVDWTSVNFVSLGSLAKGRLEVVDDCDVNISGCLFSGMDTFAFKASSDVLACTFLACGVVTANGAKLAGTKFSGFAGAADSSQVVWDTAADVDGKLDGCAFAKGAAATHAVQLGTTSPTSVTFRGCAFSGYNAANEQNDSTILVSRMSGTVTINVVGCSGNISYKRAAGSTATVVIASNPVSATVTVKDTAVPPVAIEGARVLVLAYSGGPMPYNATVTIANAGTTATVSHTAHGMASNDKVQITGASLWQNNGVFIITKVNDNQYTYTLPEAPGSSPTGTIKATYAALEGLTSAAGVVTMSRSFTSDQPVTGRARKSSSAPFYKTTDFTGTIKSASGLDVTVQLQLDA